MRFIAEMPRKYIKNYWNVFDVIIIALSYLSFIFTTVSRLDSNRYLFDIMNCLQILRVFRVIKNIRFLKKMFITLRFVVPETINLLILLLIIFLIYSIIGRDLFCYLKPQAIVGSENIHFKNAFYALLTLFRGATGESWYLFYSDCKRKIEPNFICVDIKSYNDFKKYG